MRIYGTQLERNRNDGQAHKYQLLYHETAVLQGRDLFQISAVSVRKFRCALSEQIHQEIFYVNLTQDIES